MSYTLTSNLSLKLPEIGGSTDTWGQNLLDNFTDLDSTINTIQTDLLSKADTSSLGSYVTITTSNLSNYTTTANTVLSTASDVTVTSPATNDFLVYSGSAWVNKTKAQAQVSLLPTYGQVGEVLRIASGGSTLEWATLGFQFSYTSGATDPTSGMTNGVLFFNGTSNQLKIYNNTWVTVADTSSAALFANNNLSDLGSASTARTNLDVDQAGTATAMAIALG